MTDWRNLEVSPPIVAGVIGGVAILLVVLACPKNPSVSPSQNVEDPPPVSQQLGNGNRAEHLRNLAAGLSLLIERYEEVGPASVNLYVDTSGWNSMSHDQQQQLMDELASKQITRDIGATLHIYAGRTEVGTIGPGWGGEWRFRREGS